MAEDALQSIAVPVARVRRRLIGSQLIRTCAAAWLAGLVLAAAWMLLEPVAAHAAEPWRRWAILGGLIAVGTVWAVARTLRQAPRPADAALAIDREFGLSERVVTAVSLSPVESASPAGQALLADAQARIAGIHIAERFPIRLPWSAAGVPLAAGAVALIALFYHPEPPVAQGGSAGPAVPAEAKSEINKKLDELVKKSKAPEKPGERMKSEDLMRLEAKLEEIAKQPRDTTKQLRDRIKDLTPLEEEMKKLERQRAEKAQALQQALQQKDRMMPNDVPQDGPARDLQKALAEGDLDKAKSEVEQLAKKLAENKLSDQEKKDLAKQLDNLAQKMEQLAQQKSKEDQLRKLHEDGKLDAEALQRELEQLRQENEKLQDLQKLAQKLGECRNGLKSGDAGKAARSLGQAARQLEEMELDTQELENIRDQLQRLQDAKDAMCKACESESECNGLGRCDGDGQCQGRGRSSNNGRNDFANSAGQASGRRPDGQQGKVNTFDAKQAAQFNPKGQKTFDGYAPGQAFKKKPGAELVGEIQQAAQEAPDAIEVQRIPRAAREMAKGYFRNLGGQQPPKKE
jgi:septal ring factor EnvC (AmiA/AmiB activator)